MRKGDPEVSSTGRNTEQLIKETGAWIVCESGCLFRWSIVNIRSYNEVSKAHNLTIVCQPEH